MTIEEIRTLFGFNRWANARVIKVIESLSEKQITEQVESSFPSILMTFSHIVGAEWIWLQRWKGEHPRSAPDWMERPEFNSLKIKLMEVEKERDLFLGSINAEDLERVVSYRTLDGTPGQSRFVDLFVHLVNHSTYHRGQLATLIRRAGGLPVATDYVLFKSENG